jgi:hypothetical protein
VVKNHSAKEKSTQAISLNSKITPSGLQYVAGNDTLILVYFNGL